MITIEIPGEVVPTQSTRVTFIPYYNKEKGKCDGYLKFYQLKEVTNYKTYVGNCAREQLPKGFKIFHDCPLRVLVEAIFPPLKSFTKKQLEVLRFGGLIYKFTKPDLPDNIMKGIFDGMEGIVYKNDSQVAVTGGRKYYGLKAKVIVKINTIQAIKPVKLL